ncbi:MAG: hypothetical protein WC332_00725 [Clostridia bacterium]|jgi:rRNA maturation endonuclease Nob1
MSRSEINKRYRDSHLEFCKESVRKAKERYVKERRCVGCATPLIAGEIKTCVNCGHTIRGEMKYAKDSVRLTEIF